MKEWIVFSRVLSNKRRILSVVLAAALIAVLFTGCAKDKASVRKQAESQRELGEALMQEGRTRPALREFLKAEDLHPNDVRLQNDIGLVLLALGRPDEAKRHFSKAVDLDPKFADARNNLGSTYLALEQWDIAIKHFEMLRANLIYATPFNSLAGLGYAYFKKGDYARSVQYYIEAVDMAPDFAIGWRGLGRVYLAQERLNKAVKALEKAVELAPKFVEAYFDLSEAYNRIGRKGDGAAAHRKVCELAPDSELCQQSRSNTGRP